MKTAKKVFLDFLEALTRYSLRPSPEAPKKAVNE